jgi:hypothetical protein
MRCTQFPRSPTLDDRISSARSAAIARRHCQIREEYWHNLVPTVAVARCRRHSWLRAIRAAETTLDLFSGPLTAKVPEPSVVSQGKAGAKKSASPPRYFLPRELAGALKRLDDVEIDALLAAIAAEAGRRGRLRPSQPNDKSSADPKPRPRKAVPDDSAGSLTTGKLNAVRAAFKAGVKLSAIARQFGISQSDARKALADSRAGKPGQ